MGLRAKLPVGFIVPLAVTTLAIGLLETGIPQVPCKAGVSQSLSIILNYFSTCSKARRRRV